jgi:hypothetical protein
MKPISLWMSGCIFLLGIAVALAADRPQPQSGPLATPLTDPAKGIGAGTGASIDNAASAEWVAGAERPLANPNALRQIVWTQNTLPNGNFLQFGASSESGTRHLRLGFTRPVEVGSVLVRGGGELSVLLPNAVYPGNLGDDSQWTPAQRVTDHELSTAPVDRGSYALWVLPPGTKTRALRFKHIASPTDQSYAGVLGGVYLLSGRFINLAPQATVSASENNNAAPLLINEKYDEWHTWDNGPDYAHPVTTATPEWITLAWPRAVGLRGLAALWAGFNGADAQIFTGAEKADPSDAPDADWHSIGQPMVTHNQYPQPLGIDWLDFGKTVVTRAVRLHITQVSDESHHPHLAGKTRDGNRVWLGELMAISPLESNPLQAPSPPIPAAMSADLRPPIAVHFKLEAPGFVSLVIDDAQGDRVRNLISDTWFEAGSNTVWWDGSDDLGRVPDAAEHGVYLIPTHFVSPGNYTVRGLYHKAIHLRYEFSVYNGGHPAWETADGKGGWLTNHTPPSSTLFVPADKAPGGKPLVYLGSYVSEGGAGLAWVDLEGHKQGGRGWIGGSWTAAPYLARDSGSHANQDAYAYVGAGWREEVQKDSKKLVGVIRLTALTKHGDKPILNYHFDPGDRLDHDEAGKPIWTNQMQGIAVHDDVAVVSLSRMDQLLFADATNGKILGLAPVENPRGLAFDSEGHLLVLSGKRLLRYTFPADSSQLNFEKLAKPLPLVSDGLEDPVGLTVDSDDNIYVSDRGNANQVRVYSSSGRFVRAIGHAGPSRAGPYDALHMNNPRGMTIDSDRHLWVAEEDFQPKRVSVWTLDGRLIKAFYGPTEYGGGGVLDAQDKTRFYYHGMEFKLDWKTGTDTLTSVLYRPTKNDLQLPLYSAPASVLYSNGRRYFTNTYMGHATTGLSIGVLYLDTDGTIRPVAALGRANDWNVLKSEVFKAYWPKVADPSSRSPENSVFFTWSDVNNDGKVEPEEVTFLKSTTGAITVMPDLAMMDAFVDGKAMRYAPAKVTSEGIPVYELARGEVIAEGAQKPYSDGGGQALYSPQATVLTTAPTPFAQESVGGIDKLGHRWSYPSLWPGLHPSHSAPVADHPGELEGTTRLLGGFIKPKGSDAQPLWGINGNFGDMYLFTADGLFVTQLFQDVRVGKPWNMPQAERNMLLDGVSLHDENFFPALTQTTDGEVYVSDGDRASIVRVDGLETLRVLAPAPLEVKKEDLDKAQTYIKEQEVSRQKRSGVKTLEVTIHSDPAWKDLSDSLKTTSWATIDRRITKVGWNEKPDVTEAAITIAGGRLFAEFRAENPNLLQNSGAIANAPFKTGGALDLMIGTNPHANPKRETPVAGDIRLLVYQVSGKTRATLYRAVVPGTADPIPFSSPGRTVAIDKVEDVSDQVELQTLDAKGGSYIFSIPLEALGMNPAAGDRIKADIGVLRGEGGQTLQRVYWSNKATGITSDVPSEAELTPNLWGEWVFKTTP